MQIEPKLTIFDTTALSIEHPISPEGSLYTSFVSEVPAALHYHDFFEIGYCEYGSGIFIVDGEPVPFNGQCCSIIYPGQAHIAQSADSDRSLWHFLYIDLVMLYSGSVNIGPEFLTGLKSSRWHDCSFPCILPRSGYPEFYEIIKQIMAEGARMLPGAFDTMRGLCFALLKMHERLFVPVSERKEKSSSRLYLTRELEPAINYINEHYRENITIEELTGVSKMSKSNLQRKMIALTGRAPLQYVHFMRMKYACALLGMKKLPISEVASEVGYSLSSFNRQFQKEFGMSPSRWQKGN